MASVEITKDNKEKNYAWTQISKLNKKKQKMQRCLYRKIHVQSQMNR